MVAVGAGEEDSGKNLFASSGGKVRSETLETAITCNSIWEEEETGTGATGAEGVFGAEQQGILQQWWPGQQHELVAGAVPAKAITGDAARRNTSDNATANLVSLNPMPF